jgi:hypothetical protein
LHLGGLKFCVQNKKYKKSHNKNGGFCEVIGFINGVAYLLYQNESSDNSLYDEN